MIDKSIEWLTRLASAGAAVASSLRRVIRNVSMRVIRERQLSDYRDPRPAGVRSSLPGTCKLLAITKIRATAPG